MRKSFLVLAALVIALLASTLVAFAAPPSDTPPGSSEAPFATPPGLLKAIAAQEKHNPQLLTAPGVVGTAVGLGADGTAVVRVFTERPGVGHVPRFLDGIPVMVQATGKLVALKKPPETPGGKGKNAPPAVTIGSPEDGAQFNSGDSVHFVATATDDRDGDLSGTITWTSSVDGFLHEGAEFSAVLSDGTHTITASATDSGRKTGTDSVTVTVTGTSGELTTTDWWTRPVPIGISTGNSQSASAGTIACRVVDGAGNVYALSNTHVYAPNDIDGQGELGDTVTQPGLYDVPGHAYDSSLYLGELSAYKPINGSIFAVNDIDAAIALTDTDKLGNSTPVALGGYGVPSSSTRVAALSMAVQKFGRTTLLTKGTVTGINATMAIGYDDNWYAWFGGQIIVEPSGPDAFILPGDSGSLMVTDDDASNPVGLVFAGNADGTMAIANPIDSVLDHFGVVIDGKE